MKTFEEWVSAYWEHQHWNSHLPSWVNQTIKDCMKDAWDEALVHEWWEEIERLRAAIKEHQDACAPSLCAEETECFECNASQKLWDVLKTGD